MMSPAEWTFVRGPIFDSADGFTVELAVVLPTPTASEPTTPFELELASPMDSATTVTSPVAETSELRLDAT